MKKKFFLIGALVAMSMSAMFVACNNKSNEQVEGCTCTVTDRDGYGNTFYLNFVEMAAYGARTCNELAAALRAAHAVTGNDVPTVNCR